MADNRCDKRWKIKKKPLYAFINVLLSRKTSKSKRVYSHMSLSFTNCAVGLWWSRGETINKYRSTTTVHTSAKARLSWLSVVSRWRNAIIVAMTMPAAASRNALGWYHFPYLPIVTNPERSVPVSRRWSGGSPPKFNYFVHWPIANLPWKFHANPFIRFCTKLLTDRQTDRQTNNDANITSLAEVKLQQLIFHYSHSLNTVVPNSWYVANIAQVRKVTWLTFNQLKTKKR